jgi:poly-D-alanine transfer protein DltD
MPTGFDIFGVGHAGTTDLLFLETFGALGSAVRNEKVIISDSPQWYYNRAGTTPQTYAGNFSPEIADAFVFGAPLSLPLREATARRMLAYPATLNGRVLLRQALADLADGSPLHLARYFALLPAGRIESFFQQMQDAYQTVKFIRQHKEYRPNAPAAPRKLDWSLLLTTGTAITRDTSTPDPFGFSADVSSRLRTQAQYRSALQRYCSGQIADNGSTTPFAASWEDAMLHSVGWTDLRLELQALHELDAQPLVFTIPLPGLWYDEIGIPVKARDAYYRQYMRVTGEARVAALDMRANDEDRFFLHDTGAHFSPRGWLYANRAIDMFWHGHSVGDIRVSLATMNRRAPPVGLPDPHGSRFCQ